MFYTAKELEKIKTVAIKKLNILENDVTYGIAARVMAGEIDLADIESERIEEIKEYRKAQEAYLYFYKSLLTIVFETDFLSQLERNVLDYDTLESIDCKYDIRRTYRRWANNTNTVRKIFKNYFSWIDVTKRTNFEKREILAYFRSRFTQELLQMIVVTLTREEGNYKPSFARYFKQLARLEYLEEVISLGTEDLHINSLNLSRYVLNYDFGMGV